MKHFAKLLWFVLLFSGSQLVHSQTGAIRINQVGYYPTANKIAIVVYTNASTFEVVNIADDVVVLTGNLSSKMYWPDAGDSIKQADFSELTQTGIFKIRIPEFGESYPFEISDTVFSNAAYASLKTFYYQRCSYELTAPYAGLWPRAAGHPDTICILHSSTGKSGNISSPGGWYDAGDYGKYVVNAGISVANMLSFYENFSNFFADSTIIIPESGNGKNDLLDEVKVELDWLKTMQDNDGGVFFKLTTLSHPGFSMPKDETGTRYVIGKATASTLDFAAMMAMAARIYKDYDAEYAADCEIRAENAWVWAKANPAIYFKNPAGVSTGEYGDANVSDEFIWAATELYITTQKNEFKTYLESKSSELKYENAPSWPNVKPLSSLSLATQANGLSESLIATIKNSIISKSDTWLNQINSSACHIPQFNFNWGSNSEIANIGIGLLYAYILTNDTKYIKGAAECADYLMGKNATGYSYVTWYGYKSVMNIHHRPSASDGIVQPIPGFLSGGPNKDKQDGLKYPFSNPAKSFLDVTDSYASNEIAINWNAPFTALLAGIDAVLGNSSKIDFKVEISANNPPTISLTSPAYGTKINDNKQLLIKSTATDSDGISKVELYIDSRFVDALTEAPFQWTFDALAVGNHTVTVLAFDSNSLSSEKTNAFSYIATTSIENQSLSANENSLIISPNPVTNNFTIKYNLTSLSPIEFTICDMNGRLIDTLKNDKIHSLSGEQNWIINGKLSSGTYYLSLHQNDLIIASIKFIKL